MYENPITKYMRDIETQIREAEDGQLIYEVKQAVGFAVDKQELIKALEYDRDQYNKGYEDGLNADKWIPVSEKLPKPNQSDGLTARYYLIQNEYGDMLVARYDGIGWEQIYQYDYLEDEVIAWMPLPKPFEPQKSEDEE